MSDDAVLCLVTIEMTLDGTQSVVKGFLGSLPATVTEVETWIEDNYQKVVCEFESDDIRVWDELIANGWIGLE